MLHLLKCVNLTKKFKLVERATFYLSNYILNMSTHVRVYFFFHGQTRGNCF